MTARGNYCHDCGLSGLYKNCGCFEMNRATQLAYQQHLMQSQEISRRHGKRNRGPIATNYDNLQMQIAYRNAAIRSATDTIHTGAPTDSPRAVQAQSSPMASIPPPAPRPAQPAKTEAARWAELCSLTMEAVDAGLAIVFTKTDDAVCAGEWIWQIEGKLYGALGNKDLRGHALGTCRPHERGDLEAMIEERRKANAVKRTASETSRLWVGSVERNVGLLRADLLHMTAEGIADKLAQIQSALKEQIR